MVEQFQVLRTLARPSPGPRSDRVGDTLVCQDRAAATLATNMHDRAFPPFRPELPRVRLLHPSVVPGIVLMAGLTSACAKDPPSTAVEYDGSVGTGLDWNADVDHVSLTIAPAQRGRP